MANSGMEYMPLHTLYFCCAIYYLITYLMRVLIWVNFLIVRETQANAHP